MQTIARLMAPYVRDQMRMDPEVAPQYYSQADSPLGRRQHLELVRRGILGGKKVGRRILVCSAESDDRSGGSGARRSILSFMNTSELASESRTLVGMGRSFKRIPDCPGWVVEFADALNSGGFSNC